MSTHLGTENFLEVPTVNGVNVLTALTGTLVGSVKVLQVVTGTILASTNSSGTPPWDGTPPLNTEGSQLWSQAFTPLSATSRILIMQTPTISHANSGRIVTTSFFAGAVNIGATGATCPANNAVFALPLSVVYSPGSTALITFSCRGGANGAGICYFNQASAGSLGGAAEVEYVIMEIAS